MPPNPRLAVPKNSRYHGMPLPLLKSSKAWVVARKEVLCSIEIVIRIKAFHGPLPSRGSQVAPSILRSVPEVRTV